MLRHHLLVWHAFNITRQRASEDFFFNTIFVHRDFSKARMCGQALILALMLWLLSKNIVQKSARATAQVWVPAVQHERGYLVSVRVQDDQNHKDKCRRRWITPSWKTIIT